MHRKPPAVHIIRFFAQQVKQLRVSQADEKIEAGIRIGLDEKPVSYTHLAVSDEDGLATFEGIPYGTYTIAETQALPGYLKNPTQVPICLLYTSRCV